jgi:hypothetical protein
MSLIFGAAPNAGACGACGRRRRRWSHGSQRSLRLSRDCGGGQEDHGRPQRQNGCEPVSRQPARDGGSVQNAMNAVVCFSVSSHGYSLPVRYLHAALDELQQRLGVGNAILGCRQSGVVTGLFGQAHDPVVHPPAQRAKPEQSPVECRKQLHGGIVPANMRSLVGQDGLQLSRRPIRASPPAAPPAGGSRPSAAGTVRSEESWMGNPPGEAAAGWAAPANEAAAQKAVR